MAMFGSENPAMMGGGGYSGSMDPMMLEAMMKNMPELQARQRRAAQLRGTQDKFGAMGQGPAGNYTSAQMGGLGPTIQKYHTDYGKIGDAAVGALGGYMTGKQAETAQGSADEMLAQQALGAAQAFGGGNTGGRMGDPMGGMGSGLSAPPTQMAMPNAPGGLVAGTPGVGMPQGSAGPEQNTNQLGSMRQNTGMSMRGNSALANLSRWFGQ